MSLFDRSQGSQLTVITVSSLLGHECKEASILAALYIARKMRRSPGAGYPGVVVTHTVLSRADLKIKTRYKSYGQRLEELLEQGARKGEQKDEMQLLTLFIEKWDKAHNCFADADPVQLLRGWMEEKDLKAKEIADLLGVGKSLISEILHHKKG